MAPRWWKRLRARRPTGTMHMSHWWPPYRLAPGDRGSTPPPSGSIIPWPPMIREADPPTRTVPRFPAETAPWTYQATLPGTGHPGYQPTNPAVETERKCPPGSNCSQPVPNGHTKTHHHRLADSVLASPHPVRLMAAVLQRLQGVTGQPECPRSRSVPAWG